MWSPEGRKQNARELKAVADKILRYRQLADRFLGYFPPDSDSGRALVQIKRKIEAALPKWFRLDSEVISVLVLTHADLRAVVKKKPKGFGEEPATYHSDAIFLIGIDAAKAMQVFDPHPDVDRVWPGDGVVYSQRLSAQRTKSRLNKAISTPLYKAMTIRSWTTTLALLGRLDEVAAALATEEKHG